MNLWFDFTNPPHVNFFEPVMRHFRDKGASITATAREFVETSALLKQKGIDFKLIGKHGGGNKLKKIMALIERDVKLYRQVRNFDFSLSSNNEAPQVSWAKRKPALVFDDNDISPNWLYAKFARHVICPSAIDKKAMKSMGIGKDKLITYNGFKEDIYIADYKPDPEFHKKVPFADFITIRPENIYAAYMPAGAQSIVKELVLILTKKGYNILYLPRYEIDRTYIRNSENVYIPDQPLNGLDVCFYSKAVLTGAGTFSREAALMGTPAVSFFAGKTFLSVDKELFNSKKIFFSRNPSEIVDYVISCNKEKIDFSRNKLVQTELFSILDKLVEKIKL